MTHRDALARLPEPRYTCRQASSYDRSADSGPGTPTWFSNWDRSQFVRVEQRDGRREHVLLDADGPGAVVRFWATWHGPKGQPFSNGTLRVYLDGAAEPAIEGPITEVIDGGLLATGPLSQGVSPRTEYKRRGHNLYLPIPYAQHCKITYETDVLVDVGGRKGEALYYQINYRTYDDGAEVESFSMARLAAAEEQLNAAQQRLADESPLPTGKTLRWSGPLAPGQSREVLRRESGGALRAMMVRLSADDLPQALRSTVLKMEFDGAPTVWAPVGDFFGAGYAGRPFRTWYTALDDEGTLACRWVMPFGSGCRVTLENLGDQRVDVERCDAVVGDWRWDERSMHFYATWRQLSGVNTGTNSGMDEVTGARDVNYVRVEGAGVYVGDTLVLCNGAAKWWGEGDEKIYVDGEPFPSHFGTGTEDYYGYAWCRPEPFAAPLHAQPNGDGNLKGGYAVNSRYRALDAIPFESSIKFDMELWHWAETKMNYAPTSFFYARPGAATNVRPDPAAARLEVALTPADLGVE